MKHLERGLVDELRTDYYLNILALNSKIESVKTEFDLT
jgi:hypothetical protein